MIFRQKCVCVLIFTISILIVTGCEEFTNDRYDEGYDDGYNIGYNIGYEESKPPIINQITINPIPPSVSTNTIQDLFVYKNIKITERIKGFSIDFSGEITNLTGAEFSLAEFEITLYDANRRIIDTDTILIGSFRPDTTRFFKELIIASVEDIRYYSIKFISG